MPLIMGTDSRDSQITTVTLTCSVLDVRTITNTIPELHNCHLICNGRRMAAMGAFVQDYQPCDGYIAPIYAVSRFSPKGGVKGTNDDLGHQGTGRKKRRLSRMSSHHTHLTPSHHTSSYKKIRRQSGCSNHSHRKSLQLNSSHKKRRRQSRGSFNRHLTPSKLTSSFKKKRRQSRGYNQSSNHHLVRGATNPAGADLQEYAAYHRSLHSQHEQFRTFYQQGRVIQEDIGTFSRYLGSASQSGPQLVQGNAQYEQQSLQHHHAGVYVRQPMQQYSFGWQEDSRNKPSSLYHGGVTVRQSLQQGSFGQENTQYKPPSKQYRCRVPIWQPLQQGSFEQENTQYEIPLPHHGRTNVRQPLGAIHTNEQEPPRAARKEFCASQSEYSSGVSFLPSQSTALFDNQSAAQQSYYCQSIPAADIVTVDGHIRKDVIDNILKKQAHRSFSLTKDETRLLCHLRKVQDRDMPSGDQMSWRHKRDQRAQEAAAILRLRPLSGQSNRAGWGVSEDVNSSFMREDSRVIQPIMEAISNSNPKRAGKSIAKFLDHPVNCQVKTAVLEELEPNQKIERHITDGIRALAEHYSTTGSRTTTENVLIKNLALSAVFSKVKEGHGVCEVNLSEMSRRININRPQLKIAVDTAHSLLYNNQPICFPKRQERKDCVRTKIQPFVYQYALDDDYTRFDSNQGKVNATNPSNGQLEEVNRRIWIETDMRKQHTDFLSSSHYQDFKTEHEDLNCGFTVFQDVLTKVAPFVSNPKAKSW